MAIPTRAMLARLAKLNDESHHNVKRGGFSNPWPSFYSESEQARFSATLTLLRRWRKVEVPKGPDALPVLPMRWDSIETPPTDNMQITWIGHASVLVQFDGFNILADPIFSDRCSASQLVGPKRYTPLPHKFDEVVEQLPPIDVVIISHNHYDHLDTNTVRALIPKVRRWCVPLGVRSWMISTGVDPDAVVELDWWGHDILERVEGKQSENADDNGQAPLSEQLSIICTPCQHFSGRKLIDQNSTLWSSWAIVGPSGKRFWFGGDTGYRSVRKCRETLEMYTMQQELDYRHKLDDDPVCPAFEQIGKELGPFDLAAIPIGAYSPRWFMSPIHCSPEDAVALHSHIGSKKTVGVHWGTFSLTDEPVVEPAVRLREELQRLELSTDSFVVLKHGETMSV